MQMVPNSIGEGLRMVVESITGFNASFYRAGLGTLFYAFETDRERKNNRAMHYSFINKSKCV